MTLPPKADFSAMDFSHPLDAVVRGAGKRVARCRLLDGNGEFFLRASGVRDAVPGEILTIFPEKTWRFGGFFYLAGELDSRRLDVGELGLEPLPLEYMGLWDPAKDYWREENEDTEPWEKEIVNLGPRPSFEMSQVIPGADPDDIDSDPILRASDRMAIGDYSGARKILTEVLESDLRCLDAHAHLGQTLFDHSPARAIRHFEVGVRTGELSLGADFDGVLPWGFIDNRPFLRCLAGFGLCLWRLERFEEAATVFHRMLRLNPSDNQGVRFLIDSVRERETWEWEEETMDMHALAAISVFDWPRGATEMIMAVLRDPEAPDSERILAAELAGDTQVLNDALAEELRRILVSPDEPEPLRGEAAFSLAPALEEAEIEDPEELESPLVSEEVLLRAKASLRRIYHDPDTPKVVRRRALEVSVRSPEKWHPGAIRAAFHGRDPDWKVTALFCMRFIPGFDQEIVAALESTDPSILIEAVWAATDQAVGEAWPYVRHLVLVAASGLPNLPKDPDAEKPLLLAAMNAVGAVRPLEAHEVLDGFLDSEDEELAEAARDILSMVEFLWMPPGEDLDQDTIWH